MFDLLIKNRNNNNVSDIDKLRNKAFQTWQSIPNEILESIFNLIPEYNKINLCKKFYNKYHNLIKSFIPISLYESYIRSIIRDDSSFVFQHILNENFSKWFLWKNYRYKSFIYKSYLYFIYSDIDKYKSEKCKNIFIKSLEDYYSTSSKKSTFNAKNWFKNNNIKNVKIQWTN